MPGGGAIATAAGLALFYQAILRDLEPHDGPRIWEAETVAEAIRPRTGDLLDPVSRVPANRGLGVVIAGDDGHRTWRGFGHGGEPAPSVTTALAARSPGQIPGAASRSPTAPTHTTGISGASRVARSRSEASRRISSSTDTHPRSYQALCDAGGLETLPDREAQRVEETNVVLLAIVDQGEGHLPKSRKHSCSISKNELHLLGNAERMKGLFGFSLTCGLYLD